MKNKPHTKTKICVICEQRKKKSEFFKYQNSLDGYGSYCKLCQGKYAREHREENREHYLEMQKRYREENYDKIKAYHEEYYSDPKNAKRQAEYLKAYGKVNRKKMNENSKKWFEENKEYCRIKARQYYYDNKEKILERTKANYKKK